jgi:hypothetical protein
MGLWYQTKMLIERSMAFSPDALHVLVGAAGVMLAAILIQRPLSSWWPWVLVFLAVSLNEVADVVLERWPSWGMQAGEGARDVLLTMSIPTLLLIALRVSPERFVRTEAKSDGRCDD